VLIVHDLPEKQRIYRAMLQDLAEIVCASSGPDAIRHVQEGELAVILLDADRPDPDVFETARLVREQRQGEETPILFLASQVDQSLIDRGEALGAVDYLLVPALAPALRTKVRTFVALHERLKAEIAERQRIDQERASQLDQERALRADAEKLSRLRDEFLATMSHELRTPLNAILGWTTLLRTRNLDEAKHARALETIERNARAQKRLIDDLLHISRIITGKVALELVNVDPRRVVEGALETFHPAATAKEVQVVPSLEDVGKVRGDFARLQQVVCNLLSNAIKFTPAGGRVEVSLARQDGEVEILVKDSGQGIKPEFLPCVFEPFRQEDGSMSRRHGGLGLGLAIVQNLVRLHNGTVDAYSAGENAGALFRVRLPALERDAPPPAVDPASSAAPPPPLLSGARLLVVDDDPASRELISGMLQGFGAQVSLADSGPTALTLLLEQRPDVMIADLGMPGMDGYALIEQVRALDRAFGRTTLAIAVTAYASLQDRQRALEAGFQGHVAKPVEADELALAIAGLTRRRATGPVSN
jgi:signal transduction histidine kinase/ActR/RegA family two-component response regulator